MEKGPNGPFFFSDAKALTFFRVSKSWLKYELFGILQIKSLPLKRDGDIKRNYPMSFFKELKRRSVFKVGIAYLVGAWLLIQVSDILLDAIGAPTWVLLALFVALAVGFFITLFFAWAFELTPDGIKKENEISRSQSIGHQTSRKLDYLLFGLIIVGIGWLVARDSFNIDSAFNSSGKTPVVILMDTYARQGVYDQETRDSSGTNADVLSDILRGLPIETHKEAIGSSWDREQQILMQQPDLILIHRSGFFHSLNQEFGFGSGDNPSSIDVQRSNKLYQLADDKLKTVFGIIGQGNANTVFLVYSRGTSAGWEDEEFRNNWVTQLENRFPILTGRVIAIAIPGGVEGGSFRAPETAKLIRQHVTSILELETY